MSAMMEMPKYQCHKQVWALKISGVFENSSGFELHFTDKRYAPLSVDAEWYHKHKPDQGPGYLVVYEDGYQSYSPAAAFEKGYAALADMTAVAQSLHPAPSQAALDVLAERRRQVETEGYTPGHDDVYQTDALAMAAACYAAYGDHTSKMPPQVPGGWPWARETFRPRDRRSNLVRAGALILAELERLDRAAAKDQS